MKIDEQLFKSILAETIDENPLACRAALLVDRVEFSRSVPTLSVSLGKRSVLRANLSFLDKHCRTESHVKALLIHEFLHILLGHTSRFEAMTQSLNVALDAVINAIIHRKLGVEYSSMMDDYYAEASGILRLLRPMEEAERLAVNLAVINQQPIDPLRGLHAALYSGSVLADDVLAIAEELNGKKILALAGGKPIFLGDHERDWSETTKTAGPVDARFRQGLVLLDAAGIFRDPHAGKPQAMRPISVYGEAPVKWKMETHAVLRRLLAPDPRGRIDDIALCSHRSPILNQSDRRGALRALWNPIIPEIIWEIPVRKTLGSVQVYLDVSASMGQVLNPLVKMLAGFSGEIRRPLWAFSTKVSEATITQGELKTRTTGGTHLGCVYQHLKKTRPSKALIITDGYVEDKETRDGLACEIEAIIPHNGHETILSQVHGIPVTRLSELTC